MRMNDRNVLRSAACKLGPREPPARVQTKPEVETQEPGAWGAGGTLSWRREKTHVPAQQTVDSSSSAVLLCAGPRGLDAAPHWVGVCFAQHPDVDRPAQSTGPSSQHIK